MRLAPWQVKGIGPQARESAREAARRSGMSLGQWLNSVILDQAAEAGLDDDGYEDAAYHQHGEDLASITERLDDLGRQMDRLAGKPTDPANRDSGTSQRIADAIENLNGRLDRLIAEGRTASTALEQRVNSVDQALAKLGRERVRAAASYAGGDPVSVSIEQATAEIAARQRALDAEFARPVPDNPREPAAAPFQCRADAAVDSLRRDLTEIGRVISAAMPRDAVETLEGEVRALGSRLEAAHRSNAPSVAGLERGLHEVRDALRGLAPAESLTGFDAAIRTLSHKIDAIADARRDPAGLRQIESAIAPLRDLAGKVASADALAALSQEVRSLAERIGAPAAGGGADVLASLDRRIASIADAIETVRGQAGRDPSPQIDRLVTSLSEKLDRLEAGQTAPRGETLIFRDLEDSIAKLTEKVDASQDRLGHLEAIERDMAELSTHLKAMQAPPVAALDYRDGEPSAVLSRGEKIALGGLEDRIAKLSEKLDASEGRLGHLASIERGMAELLTHLEAMRAAPPAVPAPAPAPSAPREAPRPEPVAAPVAPVETLNDDIAALRQAQSAGERRTRDSLEDVQGTIETVVDRLATIETTSRNDPRGAPLPPGPEPAPEPPASEPSPPRAVSPPAPPAGPARSARPPSAARPPIDPSLPADHPLEPGSGPPRPRPASVAAGAVQAAIPAASPSAAERVAASEAPLRVANGAAAEPEAKSNYLQAARRAAQMAQATQATQRGAAPAAAAAIADKSAGGAKLAQRLKTVLVAASVAAIVLAALHFAMNFFFQFAEVEAPGAPALAERMAPQQGALEADDAMPGAAQMPVVIARPGTVPGGPAPSVLIVPPLTQPASPVLMQPIAPVASAAPSIAPPGASLNSLFAPR